MAHTRLSLRNIDFILVTALLLICAVGLFSIKSATHNDLHPLDNFRKQTVGVGIGLILMMYVAASEYEQLLRRWVPYAYPIIVGVLLLLVLPKLGAHIAHSSHGAQRWINIGPIQLQPSEFTKLIIICSLSLYVTDHIETIGTWATLLKSFAHVGVPMLLIAKQPDLGTALVLLAVWFGVVTVAGAKAKHLWILLGTGLMLFGAIWQFGNVGPLHILKPYQKQRLEVFLNPNSDTRDTGYHIKQSQIAIGGGELRGQGYMSGLQSNGKFIPEQHTDFIFTIIGEEGGFVASCAVLVLFFIVLQRGLLAIVECEDTLGRLLAGGIVSMLAFHTIVNTGMTLGIMPVVGVPLPCVSYGLSNLLVTMVSIGFLLSIGSRKLRLVF